MHLLSSPKYFLKSIQRRSDPELQWEPLWAAFAQNYLWIQTKEYPLCFCTIFTHEMFYWRERYPVNKKSKTIACKLLERTYLILHIISTRSPTLFNLSTLLINLRALLGSDPADINRQNWRLAYVDVVRVDVSDPSYQCQTVSADSSVEEAAAAAHLDCGVVAKTVR